MRIIPTMIIGAIARFLQAWKRKRTEPKSPSLFRAHAPGIGNLPSLVAVLLAGALALAGCDRPSSSVLPTSKMTAANYDQIRPGMSKTQVESILGPPTTAETKDMVIFKKTTYRYEEGTKFILLTFKNEELESKDSNLTAQR
jgi:SmpA / OmlA family